MGILYLRGQEPQYWRRSPPSADHRFVLGTPADPRHMVGRNPLVVIGMNPSHASDTEADTTVNRVIQASLDLNHSSWSMLNLYPERSSKPADLGVFDPALSTQNCDEIQAFLRLGQVNEVLGAWGDLKHRTLRLAKLDVLAMLKSIGVRVYYYGTLTEKGNPRHPNPRGTDWDLGGSKTYLH